MFLMYIYISKVLNYNIFMKSYIITADTSMQCAMVLVLK